MSTVVPFRRPPEKTEPKPKPQQAPGGRRTLGEFAVAMAMMGLIFYLLPSLWSGVPMELLAVINLLVAAVYVSQGPRIVAIGWIALSLVLVALVAAPSPVSYAIARGVAALGL